MDALKTQLNLHKNVSTPCETYYKLKKNIKNLNRRQLIGIVIIIVSITAYLLIENKLDHTMSGISTALGLLYILNGFLQKNKKHSTLNSKTKFEQVHGKENYTEKNLFVKF